LPQQWENGTEGRNMSKRKKKSEQEKFTEIGLKIRQQLIAAGVLMPSERNRQ
jgi:hypothetical protein